jgi:hypothetical protein
MVSLEISFFKELAHRKQTKAPISSCIDTRIIDAHVGFLVEHSQQNLFSDIHRTDLIRE